MMDWLFREPGWLKTKRRWYDWLFVATVGAFAAAIVFVVVDSVMSVRLWRVIVSLLAAGSSGVVAMSLADDVDLEWRIGRTEEKDAPGTGKQD